MKAIIERHEKQARLNPDFENEIFQPTEWEYYIPYELQDIWRMLPPSTRCAAVSVASEAARNYKEVIS